MFAGPLMIIGLCIVGWLMIWARPYYGFALTFAVGLFAYIVGVNMFYMNTSPDILRLFGGFLFFAAAVALIFLALASGIVALRKRTRSN